MHRIIPTSVRRYLRYHDPDAFWIVGVTLALVGFLASGCA